MKEKGKCAVFDDYTSLYTNFLLSPDIFRMVIGQIMFVKRKLVMFVKENLWYKCLKKRKVLMQAARE